MKSWLGQCLAVALIPSVALGDPARLDQSFGRTSSFAATTSAPSTSPIPPATSDLPAPLASRGTPPLVSRGTASAPTGMATVIQPVRAELVRTVTDASGSAKSVVDTAGAWPLIDGDASTVLSNPTGSPVRLRVRFSERIWLDGLSVWGGGAGGVRLTSVTSGRSALEETFSAESDGETAWRRAQVTEPVLDDVFELEWVPGSTGLPAEIAFWARGSAPELEAGDVTDRIHAGILSGGSTFYGTPSSAQVSTARLDGEPSAQVRVMIPSLAGIGRAFLVYELEGAPHFVAVGRSLNGTALLGARTNAGFGAGGFQVEEIPTRGLTSGENRIDFFPADPRVSGGYRIRDVRLVTVPKEGFRAAFAPEPSERQATFDRSIDFEGSVTLGELAFRLDSKSKGALVIEAAGASSVSTHGASKSAKKGEAARLELKLDDLEPGWHRAFLGDALGTKTALRVRTVQGVRPGALTNVVVEGLRVPTQDRSGLVVSYPLAGECFDGRAIVRGFVRGGDGSKLLASGEPIEVHRDGSFEFSREGRMDAPWSIDLVASVRGKSEQQTRLAMQPCLAELGRDRTSGPVADVGAPHAVVVGALGGTLEFGGAKLEIPVGALNRPTRLTIRPLEGGEVPEVNPGTVNVTPGGRAYRFGPHGIQFNVPIKITLPIDESRIPPAGKTQNVASLYYDDVTARWEPVSRFSDGSGGRLVSLTDHFTDFINATIATPDGPGMESFTPTSMKDMELGSPFAGVTSITPPTATPSGAATMSFPLELPPGRNGMQPSLALTYSSQGDSTWLGQGWDLSLSKIELDTRYGVPDYEGRIQSAPEANAQELLSRAGKRTYVLDGDQLTEEPGGTGTTRRFKRRVEGSFQRILRVQGTDGIPYFEVTAQDGTRFIYGKSEAARLADPLHATHVFRWALEEVIDVFGNGIKYAYEKDLAPIGKAGENDEHPVMSAGLYPTRIEYTTHTGSLDPAYFIEFNREKDPQGHSIVRDDPSLNGRPCFLVSERYLLGSVRVGYQGSGPFETIRTYHFSYTKGAFGKSLLQNIRETGRNGTEFYRHTMTYRSQSVQPFSPVMAWDNGAGVSGAFQEMARFRQSGSSESGSGTLGLGFLFLSASGTMGGGSGDLYTLGRMDDLNGDRLPDLLHETSGYRLGGLTHGQWGVTPDSSPGYRPPVADDFSNGALGDMHSSSSFESLQGSALVFGASVYQGRSTDEEKKTIVDMNGDGRPDLVRVGPAENPVIHVRLNRGDGFYADETEWGSMQGHIVAVPRDVQGTLQDGGTGPGDAEWSAALSATTFPVDAVAAWVAPFEGRVRVTGDARRVTEHGDAIFAYAEHFRIQIHPNGTTTSTLLDSWTDSFPDGELGAAGPDLEFDVWPGDGIYFRVSADGLARGAELEWHPNVEYVDAGHLGGDTLTHKRPYGPMARSYHLTSDIRSAGGPRKSFLATSHGRVNIRSSLVKASTPDELRLYVYLLDATDPDHPEREVVEFPGGQDYLTMGAEEIPSDPVTGLGQLIHLDDVELPEGRTLEFVIKSDTVVDPKDVNWSVEVEYETYFRADPRDPNATPQTPTAVQCFPSPFPAEAELGKKRCSTAGEPAGLPPLPYDLIVSHPETNLWVPTFVEDPAGSYVVAPGGPIRIERHTARPNAGVYVCQADGMLIGKATSEHFDMGPVDVPAGAQISCKGMVNFTNSHTASTVPAEIIGENGVVGGARVEHVTIDPRYADFSENDVPGPIQTMSWLELRGKKTSLSGGFHRWYFGDWNGARAEFKPEQMTLDNARKEATGPNPEQQPQVGVALGSPLNGPPSWRFRGGASIRAGVFSPGRASSSGSEGVRALRASHTHNYGIATDFFVGDFGWGGADTTTDQLFVDVNGDSLPDILTAAGVRYNVGCRNRFTQKSMELYETQDNCVGGFTELNSTFFADRNNALHQELGRSETRVLKGALDPFKIIDGVLSSAGDRPSAAQPNGASGTAGIRAFLNAMNFKIGMEYGQTSGYQVQADMNGDGLSDFVRWSPDSKYPIVRLNLGYSVSEPVVWDLDLSRDGAAVQSGAQSFPTVTQVTDGSDGIAQYFEDVGDALGHFNAVSIDSPSFTDTASASGGISPSLGFVSGGVGKTVSIHREMSALVDVTGDGMADYIQKLPSTGRLLVRPNLGGRFGPIETWDVPVWEVSPEAHDFESFLTGALADAAYGSDVGVLDVLSFQRSDDFQVSGSTMFCFFVCGGGSYSHVDTNSFGEMGLDDVNGDGFVDFVMKGQNSPHVYTRLNQQAGSNLLETISSPAGKVIKIEYGRDGNTIENPANQYILAATTVSIPDAYGGPPLTYRSTFDYGRTGKYDRDEREFFGYAQVTTIRPDGSKIEATFDNDDFYHKGLPTGTTLYGVAVNDQRTKWTHSEYEYDPSDEEPAGWPGDTQDQPLTGWMHPAESRRWTSQYEAGSLEQVTAFETRQWDPNHGNLIGMTKFGDASDNADNVNYEIIYETYNRDSVNANELYAVRAKTILTKNFAQATVKQREATFNAANAAVRTVSDRIWGGTDRTGAPHNGTLATTTIDSRDQYGSPTKITDPNGYSLTYTYDGVLQTHVASVTDLKGYSSTAGTNYYFGTPAWAQDINQNKTQYFHDEFGRVRAIQGPNDIGSEVPTIAYEYSALSNTPVPWAKTRHKDVSRNLPTATLAEHDFIETVSFADALGRTIQTKKDHLQDYGSLNVGMVVSGRVSFDALGRVHEVGQPRFSAEPATAFVLAPALHPTRTLYDELDRVISISTPSDESPTEMATTSMLYDIDRVGQDGVQRLHTRVTDPLGKVKDIYRDTDGSIREVVESNNLVGQGSVDLLTRYEYDPFDQLTRVVDAKGNATMSVYDSLGRMVALNSPDMGQTKWSYDLAGNVITKETARLRAQSKKVHYYYDDNRLTQVDYPDSPDRTYVYGTPGEAGPGSGNIAGRIKSEHSEAGNRYLAYDKLGNIVHITMDFNRMREPHCGNYIADVEYEYDSFGRMLKTRYPRVENETNCGQYTLNATNEAITYAYDQGGNLQSIFGQNQVVNPQHPNEPPHSDYLMHIGYNEFGQKVRQIAGNFLETQFTYQPRSRRLATLKSNYRNDARRAANLPARELQDLSYTYDAVGNITRIFNDTDWSNQNGTVRVAVTDQTFTYDDLYQLRTATGVTRSEQNNRNRYFVDQQYDELGNITLKDQVSYRQAFTNGQWQDEYHVHGQMYKSKYFYEAPRPHTPNLIVEAHPNENVNIGYGEYDFRRDFTYDPSGNQIQSLFRGNDRRQIEWNEDDQIKRVVKNNQELNKTLYDGQGQKTVHIHQVTGMEETAYLGAHMTLRDGKFVTKHVFAGTERLASKMDPDWFSNPPILYFHTDHLGSTNYTTNNGQNLIQHDEYFPSGELWVDQTDSRYEQAQRITFSGKELDISTGLYDFGARSYDARQGQWLSPDPALAEYVGGSGNGGAHLSKNVNGYSYAWNSPLVVRDPDGRRVELASRLDASERASVLQTAQKLTDDQLGIQPTSGGGHEISIVKRGNGTRQSGTRLVRELVGDKRTITIDLVRNDEAQLVNQSGYGGRRIRLDLQTSTTFYERIGEGDFTATKAAAPEIALGHEMIHALRDLRGVTASGSTNISWVGPDGIRLQDRLSREEAETVGLMRGRWTNPITENGLRRENGMRARAAYATPDVDLSIQGVRRICGLPCFFE